MRASIALPNAHRESATQRGSAVFAALVVLLATRTAHAHQVSVVYLDLDVRGRTLDLEARIAASDLGDPVGLSPLIVPTREQALARAPRAGRYLADHIGVTNGGARCEAAPGASALRERTDGYALALTVRYTCARQIDDLRVRYDLFFDLDPRSQAFAEVRAFGTTREQVLRDAERELHVQGDPSRLAQFVDYLTLGIEHIFTGYDHIAFLFGLLIIAGARGLRRGARYALTVVTAFTLAHSITLIAAALGLVRLPSRLVESMIAVSILYVAVENLRRADPPGRWALTFGFGLVHGFGFASVLGELGLPRRGLILSLVAFNVGVEAGQLVVVAAAFPVLLLIHRARWSIAEAALATLLVTAAYLLLARFGVPRWTLGIVAFGSTISLAMAARRFGYDRAVRLGASCAIAAFAVFWLIERAVGRVWFAGALG